MGCQSVSDAWLASTLKWSTAPSLTPGSAPAQVTVTYDSTDPQPSWQRWKLETDIGLRLQPGGSWAVGLAATSENTAGWAYFAKQEYDAALGPRLVYAYGDDNGPVLLSMAMDPDVPVSGGQEITGTVTLIASAPPGGASITLSSNNPNAATVPGSVTIPAGYKQATFTVSTSSQMQPAYAVITATVGTSSVSRMVTVLP